MDWWLLSFFIGAILSLFLPIVPEIITLLLFISLAVALFAFKSTRSTSGLFIGIAWMLLNGVNYDNTWSINNLNPIELATSPQHVTGEIINIPTVDNGNHRFNFYVSQLNKQKLVKPFIIRLSWKFGKKDQIVNLLQGQRYQLKVKFKPAHGFANEGGFSYQTWLREKHIVATGYVKSSKKNHELSSSGNLRQNLYNQYLSNLPEHPLSPLLLALSFAQRSEISTDIWQVLQGTGTQHLIAISGLHLGLVASGSFLFFLFVCRYLPLHKVLPRVVSQNIMRLNLRYLVLLLSLTVTLFYGYLADFSIPTTRALTMLFLYWLARIIGIKFTLIRWFLVTLFVLIIIEPFSLFSASFWLSVYAVAVIFLTLWRLAYTMNDQVKVWRIFKSLLYIQLSLTLFLLPLAALFYHQISSVSLFANLLAVPLMSFVVIPLSLLSLVILPLSSELSSWVMKLTLEVLQWLWQYLSYLAQLDFSLIAISTFETKILSSIILVIALRAFLSATFSLRKGEVIIPSILMVLMISLMIAPVQPSIDSPKEVDGALKWQVNILDVGQGLAIIIEQGGHAILYDTGGAYPSGFNLSEAVILPYLQSRGIDKLDKVIISHSDNDHAGGLAILLNKIKVDEVIINDVELRNVNDEFCLSGQRFHWRGLNFHQLWPKEKKGSDNNDSCVIRIDDGQNSVLLTGDISKKVEHRLVTKMQLGELVLDSNVLIAGHHGSKTSSSSHFIQTVAPEHVIFSAGFLNRWHMPAQAVVQRFIQSSATIHSTSEHGMIRFNFSDEPIKVHQYRRDLSPYWFVNAKRQFN